MVSEEHLDLGALAERLENIATYLHLDDCRARVQKLEAASAAPGFWDDATHARQTMAQLSSSKDMLATFERAQELLSDAQAASDLARETDDAELAAEAEASAAQLKHELDELELASWFDDDLDHGDAIVTITPGQGGLESQDWADMLLHMYLAYCERRGWKVTLNDVAVAEVIGIDHATFTVSGHNAYGMLKSEQGVHRLVRISPTDAKARRQTSFAGVEVLPVLPEEIEVEIDPADLRVDVYHASGPGGQGVNTTDSAVRLTHLPTGTVVTCQNERSQIQNKAAALKILKARLYEQEKARREAELEELRGPKHEISFGNQVRNYVLYPYQMIKDTRTGVETSRVDDVLKDGDLDEFIVAYLRSQASERVAASSK